MNKDKRQTIIVIDPDRRPAVDGDNWLDWELYVQLVAKVFGVPAELLKDNGDINT